RQDKLKVPAGGSAQSCRETSPTPGIVRRLRIADLDDRGIPLLPAIDEPKRIGVDDEIALGGLVDVKQLQRLWRGGLEHDGGPLVVDGPVTRAVEPVLRRYERHGAAEVGALPVGRDDPAGRMQEKEASLPEEDRRVGRGGET